MNKTRPSVFLSKKLCLGAVLLAAISAPSAYAFRPVIENEISDKTAHPDESDYTIGGRVFTDQYLYSHSGALAQSSVSSWLEFGTRNEKGLGAHAVGALNVFAKSMERPDHASVTGQVREAYLSYFGPGFSLKLGQQIIPWGKSDGINPTDYFTAKNYTFLNPDDEVRRIGAPGLNASFTPDQGNSPFTAQFVFQAFNPQSKLLIPAQVIPQGLTVNLNQANPTVFGANTMEVGGKLTYQKSAFDLSVSAYHGVATVPEFVLDRQTQSIDLINFKETAMGGDASLTLGDYVLSFESALHLPENGGTGDALFGMVEPDHLDSALGIERPFFENFRAQIQFLYRYHIHFRETPLATSGNPLLDQLNNGIAQANATLLNFQRRGNPGATFRLSYANETSKWSGEFFFVGYFQSGQDYLIRPQLAYAAFTNFKLLAGMDYYGGNSARPLGALAQLSDVFLEGKYLF